MGGKNKNRVKNNAMPSSSARSAELLGEIAFAGFPTLVASSPFAALTTSATEGLPENIGDPEIALILRKMAKRDSVTKKKALQEFIEYIDKTKDETVIKCIIPQWMKFYQMLANDIEHSVRDAAQQSLQSILKKNKRLLAPHIKHIAPVWIASRFDNYASTAAIAKATFNDTFPGVRMQQVCLLCHNEIFEYCEKNVTYLTPSLLNSNNQMTPEEAEQKYRRLVIGSFKELSFFIHNAGNALDGEQLNTAEKQFLSLLENKKFWSFAKHKHGEVRGSWFELMMHMLQNPSISECLTSSKKQLIALCGLNIDDNDVAVTSFVWSCILLIQEHFEDWHTQLDMEKFITKLSRLMRTLKDHNPTIVCPNLLPLFAKFNENILPDNVSFSDFCQHFFNDLLTSIKSIDAVENQQAYLLAYFECLRYLMQKLSLTKALQDEQEQLAHWLLNICIVDGTMWYLESEEGNSSTMFSYFSEVSKLIHFWQEKSPENDLYAKLLKTFDEKLTNALKEYLTNETKYTENFIKRVLQLLYVFNGLNSDINSGDFENVVRRQFPEGSITRPMLCLKPENLMQLSAKLVNLLIFDEKVSQTTNRLLYVHTFLCIYAGQPSFYAEVCKPNATHSNAIHMLLNKFAQLIPLANNKNSELLITIIFEILKNVESQKRWEFFEDYLLNAKTIKLQTLVIQRLLDSILLTELNETEHKSTLEKLNETLLNIAEQAICKENGESFDLLEKCFVKHHATDSPTMLIKSVTLEAIYKNLIGSLNASNNSDEFVQSCLKFINSVTRTVFESRIVQPELLGFVLIEILELIMRTPLLSRLREDALISWELILENKQLIFNKELAQKCSSIVEQFISKDDRSVEFIKENANILIKLILFVVNNLKASQDAGNEVLVTKLLDTFQEDTIEHLSNICSYIEVMKMDIGLTKSSDLFCLKFEPIDVAQLLRRTLLNIITLNGILLNLTADENDSNAIATMEDILNANLKLFTGCVQTAAIGCTLMKHRSSFQDCEHLEVVVEELLKEVQTLMLMKNDVSRQIKDQLLLNMIGQPNALNCRTIALLMDWLPDNSSVILLKDTLEDLIRQGDTEVCLNCWQYMRKTTQTELVTLQSINYPTEQNVNSLFGNALPLRLMLHSADLNAAIDSKEAINNVILPKVKQFITDVAEKQHALKNVLLYQMDINEAEAQDVVNVVEYINLLTEAIRKCHYDLTVKNWDAIRLGLSSWVLSVSKTVNGSHNCYANFKLPLFFRSVFSLFAAMSEIMNDETRRSSTALLTSVFDEWRIVFAREVNTVLFKVFHQLCNKREEFYVNTALPLFYDALMQDIALSIEHIDYAHVYEHYRTVQQLDDLLILLCNNFYSPIHSVRAACAFVFKSLSTYFVREDLKKLDTVIEKAEQDQSVPIKIIMDRFEDYIIRNDVLVGSYINEFSFKTTELPIFRKIDRDLALGFLFMWDCIVYLCSHAPAKLRPIYTNWLHEKKYEDTLLHFLFRAMPIEILRNHDAKTMRVDVFNVMDWPEIRGDNALKYETFACHLYAVILRKLPAVVRNWWSSCPSRQKTFIDKLTTNFLSANICNEELKGISIKNEKFDDMQIKVHSSSREVVATYSIEETKMELVITLAANHPLGSVKVECGKQIGGRNMSRNIGMQLSLYLMHQNGTISEGLALWKNNLDKQFEGVEECYICYTVIHQDTCQMPKLACKTCKKKFHGPCLYKWFTSSSKSTCPICRNVF